MSETIAASVTAPEKENTKEIATSVVANDTVSGSTTDTDTETTFSGIAVITLINRGPERTLISRTSKDTLHIMANSRAKVTQNFLNDSDNQGFVLVTYTGIRNGEKQTVSFKPGETIKSLKIRLSGGN